MFPGSSWAMTALVHDAWGSTVLGLDTYLSPGNMTDHNRTVDSQGSRFAAHADYVYGVASLERTTRLPGDFTWMVRGVYQDSSTDLLGGEQFGLGGNDTVRGYLEREANGDTG